MAARRPILPAATIDVMDDAVVRADGVEKEFREGERVTAVLRGVSLAVRRAELVAITGRSGCGKTTLLNLLGAMDTPTRGTIWLAGRDTSALDDRELTRLRRRAVGFVFQFFHLLPALTALENVELPLQLEGALGGAEIRRRAKAALAAVDLGARGGDYPGRLSGGEQQRVAIARALVHEPALVIADEPTGNLDSATAAPILALLRELCRRHGVAVVMATHSAEAAALADRVLPMRDGQNLEGRE